jgi:hypothetical protein
MKSFNATRVLLLTLALLCLCKWSHALPFEADINDINEITNSTTLFRRECVVDASQPSGFRCDLNPPTISQIISHMLDPSYGGTVTEESRAIFWSNLGAAVDGPQPVAGAWILGWLNRKRDEVPEWYWHRSAVNKCKWSVVHLFVPLWIRLLSSKVLTLEGYAWQARWIHTNVAAFRERSTETRDPLEIFQLCYYEALSLAAVHPRAYLFTRGDSEPNPTGTWGGLEFPALARNQNVKEIYRVDPRPPELRGETSTSTATTSSSTTTSGAGCDVPQATLWWSRERGDPVPPQLFVCPWK